MTQIAGNLLPIQQELFNFNFPVGNAGLKSIGAFLNGLLGLALPIGSIMDTMLTVDQWNSALGNPASPFWILCDGSAVSGSKYSILTGFPNVPNLCGVMRRGKNNGRSDGDQNSFGEIPLGGFSFDSLAAHTHSYDHGGPFISVESFAPTQSPALSYLRHSTGAASGGGNETAPKNITINSFIRIN